MGERALDEWKKLGSPPTLLQLLLDFHKKRNLDFDGSMFDGWFLQRGNGVEKPCKEPAPILAPLENEKDVFFSFCSPINRFQLYECCLCSF